MKSHGNYLGRELTLVGKDHLKLQDLGAAGEGAIQALLSLDSTDREAWLCRASQG